MSANLGDIGKGSAHGFSTAFEAQGRKQAQELQPVGLDEAFIANIIKQSSFQVSLFFSSIFALIPGVFLRRTYGERSFGLKAFATAVIVFWVGFGAGRDPNNEFMLSWFGPLFVFLWVGFFAFHRIEIFARKVKGAPHVFSRTDGRPWLPWLILPFTRKWANTLPGYSLITMYLDPIMVFIFGSITSTLVSELFGLTFIMSAFAMFVVGQLKSYIEMQKILDMRDSQVEAKFRLAMSEGFDSGPTRTVTSFDGFVVAVPPEPKVPGFLKDLPIFKVDEVEEEQPQTVAASSTEEAPLPPPLPASVRAKAQPNPKDDLISELDPELQDLVQKKD